MASDKVDEKVTLKVKMQVSRELQEGRYSNYATIGHSQDAFHIIFGQAMPPTKVPADKIVVAQAVAHVVVPPRVMPDFIRALSQNYEKYTKRHSKTN